MAVLFKKKRKLPRRTEPSKDSWISNAWKGVAAAIILVLAVYYFLGLESRKKVEEIVEQVEAFDEAKLSLTKVNMNTLQRAINSFMATEGRTPKRIKELQVFRPSAYDKLDGWGNEIRYERLSDYDFRLRSAGRDKTFDTEDDVVVEY
jgi:hypothetical protein